MMWKMYQFWILVIFSVLSWGMLLLVRANISPIESPQIAFPLFYIAFMLAMLFTFSVFFSLCWKAILPVLSSYICIKNGIREGILLSISSGLILFLQQIAMTHWLPVLLIIAIGIIIELFFIS